MARAPDLTNAGLFLPTTLKKTGTREWLSLRKDQLEMEYLRWPRAVPTKATPL